MWYYFNKLSLSENEIIYEYGRETKNTLGLISYNLNTKDIKIIKSSKEDYDDNGRYTFKRIFANLYNRFQKNIFDNNYMIAFG